ncbi:branched-chain amino acid ABC transporter permease [Gemmobacter sp.]|uniref:branched-chain amino acid ABC transporter permease n=1 Tax=Gemmobacter sp. TaxID=1898957 RepID=UPI002AFEFFB8|nr:branched-chain amino acid ABC transporter permease [Gemmobacter sp.]
MMQFFFANQALFDFFLLSLGFAYSQQIVLRAGVFSVATIGFVAIGAYFAGYLVTQAGLGGLAAVLTGTVVAGLAGLLLSVPLSRLRGVFQAIATLAFVEIVLNALYYFEPYTGGAMGMNRIPKLVQTWHLLVAVGLVIYLVWAIGRSGIGRAWDALRQDETVAACLGVSIRKYHTLAFVLSGAIGGLFGSMQGLYFYTITPEQFGFAAVVSVLTTIVLGGRATLAGPIIGAVILAVLPELARPLAENRLFLHGAILLGVIVFIPDGIGDLLVHRLRRWRIARTAPAQQEKIHGVT